MLPILTLSVTPGTTRNYGNTTNPKCLQKLWWYKSSMLLTLAKLKSLVSVTSEDIVNIKHPWKHQSLQWSSKSINLPQVMLSCIFEIYFVEVISWKRQETYLSSETILMFLWYCLATSIMTYPRSLLLQATRLWLIQTATFEYVDDFCDPNCQGIYVGITHPCCHW